MVGEAGVGARCDLAKQHLTLASRGPLRDHQEAEPHQFGARDGIQDGLAWSDELLQEHLRSNPRSIFNLLKVLFGLTMLTSSYITDLPFTLRCITVTLRCFEGLNPRTHEQYGPLTDELQW